MSQIHTQNAIFINPKITPTLYQFFYGSFRFMQMLFKLSTADLRKFLQVRRWMSKERSPFLAGKNIRYFHLSHH